MTEYIGYKIEKINMEPNRHSVQDIFPESKEVPQFPELPDEYHPLVWKPKEVVKKPFIPLSKIVLILAQKSLFSEQNRDSETVARSL